MSTTTKNAVRVIIGGEEYTVRSELPPEYTREVAAYLDAALKRVRDSLPRSRAHKAAILAALAITDELFQARRGDRDIADRLTAMADDLARLLPPAKRGSARPLPRENPPMSQSLLLPLLAGVAAGLAVASSFILFYTPKPATRARPASSRGAREPTAERLARSEGQRASGEAAKAELLLAAKMETLKLREELDREIQRRREEWERLERRAEERAAGPGAQARGDRYAGSAELGNARRR